MSENNKAFLHLLANVLVWSLFPVLSLQTFLSDPWAALFYSQVAGLLVTAPFAGRWSVRSLLADVMKAPGLLMVLSMASLLLGVFFVFSLQTLNPIGATITLELWPFFALIFSASFIQNKWEDITPTTIGLFLMASIGVMILVVMNTSAVPGQNGRSVLGVTLGLLAAVASGATVVQTRLYSLYRSRPSFGGACYTIALVRLAGLPVILVAGLVAGADFGSVQAMVAGGLLGATAFGLASVLAIAGLRYSTRTSHILLWYLTPAIASVWLVLFSGEKLSDTHIIAFMPILFANIFSNIRTIRRLSFFLMSAAALVIGTSIYLIPGIIRPLSLDALAVVTGVYAIIVAFLLQRKLSDIREIGLSLARGLAASRGRAVSGDAFLIAVEKELFTRPSEPATGQVEAAVLDTSDEIKVERATSFSSAEVMVLSFLTVVITVVGLFYRDNGLIYDLVAFAVCFSAVFLTVFVVEASSFRFQWRVAKVALMSVPDARVTDRDTVVLSFLGVATLLALIVLLLIDKWVVDILHNEVLNWLPFLAGP